MPSLTLKTQSGVAHIWPEATRLQRMHSAAGPADTGPLLYHTNGSIVQHPFFYQVYWRPNHLQTGSATGFSSNYINVNVALGAVYNEHGIGNNNTQYFQIIGGNGAYIANDGFLAAAVLDTDPFPAAGCNDPVTPGNCLTDAQVQAELLRVIQALKWNVGPNNIFLVYTSSGEARA